MGTRLPGSVTVLAPGAQVSSGTGSSSAAIPLCLNGQVPRYVRVAATASACIRLGVGGVTASTGDTMVQPGDALTLAVPNGVTHFAVIQVSAGGSVQVSPLEDA